MKRVALIAAAVLAFTGAEQSAPVRHLEYAFAEYPTTMVSRGYFDGVLSVDILGTGPDGGTQIRVTESYHREPRPEQSRECEIFANANVRCDDVPPYPSDSELTIFPLLARDFFSAASPTTASSWRRKYSYTFAKGQEVTGFSANLNSAPQQDGTLLVTWRGAYTEVRGFYAKSSDEARIVYDPTAAIPILVHDVTAPVPAQDPGEGALDLQLMKDSNPASAPAIARLAPPRFANEF